MFFIILFLIFISPILNFLVNHADSVDYADFDDCINLFVIGFVAVDFVAVAFEQYSHKMIDRFETFDMNYYQLHSNYLDEKMLNQNKRKRKL